MDKSDDDMHDDALDDSEGSGDEDMGPSSSVGVGVGVNRGGNVPQPPPGKPPMSASDASKRPVVRVGRPRRIKYTAGEIIGLPAAEEARVITDALKLSHPKQVIDIVSFARDYLEFRNTPDEGVRRTDVIELLKEKTGKVIRRKADEGSVSSKTLSTVLVTMLEFRVTSPNQEIGTRTWKQDRDRYTLWLSRDIFGGIAIKGRAPEKAPAAPEEARDSIGGVDAGAAHVAAAASSSGAQLVTSGEGDFPFWDVVATSDELFVRIFMPYADPVALKKSLRVDTQTATIYLDRIQYRVLPILPLELTCTVTGNQYTRHDPPKLHFLSGYGRQHPWEGQKIVKAIPIPRAADLNQSVHIAFVPTGIVIKFRRASFSTKQTIISYVGGVDLTVDDTAGAASPGKRKQIARKADGSAPKKQALTLPNSGVSGPSHSSHQ